MMIAHPQTLYGLADSPVALAAWMIDHDVASYGHIAKLFVDGEPYGDLTRDDILDNITLSWLTNTGVSSARLYTEFKDGFFHDLSISVPAAVSVFPEEIYQAPRSWTERAYHNLIHFNALPKGGVIRKTTSQADLSIGYLPKVSTALIIASRCPLGNTMC